MDAFKQPGFLTVILLLGLFNAGGESALAAPAASVLDPYSTIPAPSGKLKPIFPDANETATTYVTVPMDDDRPVKAHHEKQSTKPTTKHIATKVQEQPSALPNEKAKGGVVSSLNNSSSKLLDGGQEAGSKIVAGSKAAGSKIVEGSKAASGKLVSGSKSLGDEMANGTKKISDGIASGAKASGDIFKKGAKAFGDGMKSTGQKIKDSTQSVGEKMASVPKMITGPGKGDSVKGKQDGQTGEKIAHAKPVNVNDMKGGNSQGETGKTQFDQKAAGSIAQVPAAQPVKSAANNKGVMGKTLSIMPKMPKLPFIGGKKSATPNQDNEKRETASKPAVEVSQ